MAKTTYSVQLTDRATGKAIIAAGGKCVVITAGGTGKKTLLNAITGASLSNPITPTRGKMEFMIDSVSPLESTVDLYGMAPGGQFFVARGIKAGDPTEIWIDTAQRDQVMILPFDITDTAAATETDTGFDFVAGMTLLPSPTIFVSAIDATETLDVGLLSSESGGDADGIIDLISVGTLGAVLAAASGTPTLGALLRETVTADAGTTSARGPYTVAAAVSVTYTLTAGSDTGKGFFEIPYRIGPNA